MRQSGKIIGYLKLPRDINLDGQWIPAVILGIENSEVRIGIEGIEETAEGNWIHQLI